VAANPLADETLAMYFLEVRNELLIEWLDGVGVEHEEGALRDDAPAEPPADAIEKAVDAFRSAGSDSGTEADPDRELLLRAFAAQDSIEWPALDSLIRDRIS
jgi:hypothetical protein